MPAKITRIQCCRSLADVQFIADVEVLDSTVDEAARMGWAEVEKQLTAAVKLLPAAPPENAKPQQQSPPQQQQARAPQPVEFIDKGDGGTGEVFDVSDDARFKAALTMLIKRRGFTSPGATSLTQYLLSNARVHGFGAMKPPARLAVLEDLARGKYDSFKQGPQNGAGGQSK